eukprot:11228289-Lingulodinium_polyedra.AAC.2
MTGETRPLPPFSQPAESRCSSAVGRGLRGQPPKYALTAALLGPLALPRPVAPLARRRARQRVAGITDTLRTRTSGTSHLRHTCVTLASHLRHTCVTLASHLRHTCRYRRHRAANTSRHSGPGFAESRAAEVRRLGLPLLLRGRLLVERLLLGCLCVGAQSVQSCVRTVRMLDAYCSGGRGGARGAPSPAAPEATPPGGGAP